VSGGEDAPERPELLTSFGDYERIYGGLTDLDLGEGPVPNYVAHAALAYFNEGGSRLYVSRVVVPSAAADDGGAVRATVLVLEGANDAARVRFNARFLGAAGNGSVTVIETVSPASARTMATAPAGSLLRTGADAALQHHLKVGDDWFDTDDLDGDAADADALAGATPRIVSALVIARDADGNELSWEDVGFDVSHPRAIHHVLAAVPSRRADHLQNPFAIAVGADVGALALHDALFDEAVENAQGQQQNVWPLRGGTDGSEPTADDYRNALGEIANLEDVAIVAAPGSSATATKTTRAAS
jgi:hypothetical protein